MTAKTYSMVIQTRYHGPTNHKGARISATLLSEGWVGDPRRVMVPLQHELNADENHEYAAIELRQRINAKRRDEAAACGMPWVNIGIQTGRHRSTISDGYLFSYPLYECKLPKLFTRKQAKEGASA